MSYEFTAIEPAAGSVEGMSISNAEWRPLVDFCYHLAPEMVNDREWYLYQGGLQWPGTIELGKKLSAALCDGRFEAAAASDDQGGYPDDWLDRETAEQLASFLGTCGGFSIS